jgi:hypothetical protein
LQQTDVKEALKEWMDEGGMDLWRGVQLVHSAVDSSWNVAQSMERFEALKKEIWLELNEEQTALEQVRILNHVFFSLRNRWRVLDDLPHVPLEALPSGVLQEQKKGNPYRVGCAVPRGGASARNSAARREFAQPLHTWLTATWPMSDEPTSDQRPIWNTVLHQSVQPRLCHRG